MNLSIHSGTSRDGEEFHILVNTVTGWAFGPVFNSLKQVCDFEKYCFGFAPDEHRRFDFIPPTKLAELWNLYHDAIDAGTWPVSDAEWDSLNLSFEDYAERMSFLRRWNLTPPLAVVEAE